MKWIMMVVISMFLVVPAFGEDVYEPVTVDNEISQLTSVKVKRSIPTVVEEFYTLSDIDNQIYQITNQIDAAQARITALQAKKDELDAIKVLVEIEAKKVKLKEIDDPQPVE